MNSAKQKRKRADAETSDSTPPPTVRSCSICGRKLPANDPAVSCPVCLLRIALDPDYRADSLMNEGNLAESGSGTAEENPRRFGHYEIQTRPDGGLHELGHGAMGITFKAFDVNLRIPVTLKILKLRLFQEELARRRFLREARAAASIRIPMSLPFIISVSVGVKSFMPWSSSRGRRWRTSSSAMAGWK